MRLTDHTDYALRLLMYLAANPERNVTIREVAAVHGISHHHLTKIAHRLGQHGLLSNSRGRSGGMQLGLAPEQIMLGAVIRLTEPDFAMVECFGKQHSDCILAAHCQLKGALHDATCAWFARLDHIALSSLIVSPLRPACASATIIIKPVP